MSNPNIVTVSSMYGRTALVELNSTTSDVITNGVASGTVVKLNDVILTNYSASNVYCNVMINRSSAQYFQLGNVSIAAGETRQVINKNSMIYLEEGDVLQANASASTAISCTASYEIIS